MKFLIWLPSWGETEEYAREVKDWDAEKAAEDFVEKHWADSDYPDEEEVCVKDESGAVLTYIVMAEPTVKFKAYIKENK